MKNVLVVLEDDDLLRNMYCNKFRQDGYDVHEAEDGKKGLALIKKFKPTLVVSDLMMPEMSGLDVLRAMKAEKTLKKIPVVFLTNVDRSKEDIEKGLELGAVAYLVKSDYTPNEIVAKVKEYMTAHSSTDDLPETAQDKIKRAEKHS
ncbi:response regulator [Candidatus Gracilibacteria bacterium]|jgi:DNA-binding response OmpR family regulator|nr:response regulator [Candidatus Gracilibacteria bacterium]